MSARTRVRISGRLGLNDLEEEPVPMEDDNEITELEPLEEEQIAPATDDEVIEEAIDNVDEVGEGLEGLIEDFRIASENGGMTSGEAYYAGKALAATCGGWVKPAKTPGLESFDAAGGRLNATLEAFEGAKETLKRWWEKIKELVNRFVDSVLEFWSKYVSSAASLKRRAKSLYEAANKKKGTQQKDPFKVSKSEFMNLSYGTATPTAATVKTGFETIVTNYTLSATGSGTDNLQTAETAWTKAGEIIEQKWGNPSLMQEFTKLLTVDHVQFNGSKNVGGTEKTSAYGYNIDATVVYPGNRHGALRYDLEKIGDHEVWTGVSFHLVDIDKEYKWADKANETELTPWTIDQIKDIATELEKGADQIISHKSKWNTYRQVNIKSREKFDKLFKKIDGVKTTPANKEDIKAAKALIRGFSKTSTASLTAANNKGKAVIIAGNAAYSFAAASLAGIKED